MRRLADCNVVFKHVTEEHNGDTKVKFEMKTVKKHFSAFQRIVHESVLIERTSKAKNFSILNSRGEWGRSHLPRLKIDNSKENLVMNNGFSKEDEVWNVSERSDRKDKAKRKAFSDNKADDNEPRSNNEKSKTFYFKNNDLKDCPKAAIKSNESKPNSLQTDIFRFLAADPNFRVRKKLKRNF